MFRIVVDSEELKEELLKESKYIHDNFSQNLDSDKCKRLMLFYLRPDLVQVKEEEKI